MSLNAPTMKINLNDYRGLSAYEVAVKNGFEGSEEEWLQSLKGAPGEPGDSITVNHKRAVDGNITINGTDIYWQSGSAVTLPTKLEEMFTEKLAAFLVQSESGGEADKALSAAAAKLISGRIPIITATSVSLPISGWTQDGELYKQTVSVPGITIDRNKTSVIVSPGTAEGVDEAYSASGVKAYEQGDGVVTFTCLDVPDIDVTANVMVIVKGETA